MAKELVLTFEGATLADANMFSADLADFLLDAAPDVEVERRRDDADAMDFGATLVLVLGTPAILALANGLADWLRKRQSATIKISDASGSVIVEATGLDSADALRIADKLRPAVAG